MVAQNSALFPAYLSVEVDGKPFIFLLPRKCASNTIKDYLKQLECKRNVYLRPDEMNLTPTIPKIAIVRHPVDRLISAWKHGTQRDHVWYMDCVEAYPWMPWDEFCALVCTKWNDATCNPHFRSYSLELMSHEWGYSDVLRVESLELDWINLSNKYNFGPVVEKWVLAFAVVLSLLLATI